MKAWLLEPSDRPEVRIFQSSRMAKPSPRTPKRGCERPQIESAPGLWKPSKSALFDLHQTIQGQTIALPGLVEAEQGPDFSGVLLALKFAKSDRKLPGAMRVFRHHAHERGVLHG